MSINIQLPLKSQPDAIKPGQTAQLVLALITTKSPFETANIVYTVSAPGVTFAQTGTSKLSTTEQVFPTGSTSRTSYSLNGTPGGIPITVAVTPATPPAASGVMVTLKPAVLGVAMAAGGLPAGLAGAARKRKTAAKKKPVAKKKTVAKTKTAAKKKAPGKKKAAKKASPKRKPARVSRRR